jgi:hypothetical protein
MSHNDCIPTAASLYQKNKWWYPVPCSVILKYTYVQVSSLENKIWSVHIWIYCLVYMDVTGLLWNAWTFEG